MSSAGASEETSALITRIAAGDRDAFSRFYDLLAPTAFGLIRRVLRDPEAAAEVLQEVFWQVWREAPQYDPKRRVIELAFFEGLTQSEIATRLGEPLGTVKTRARLGLERLRGALRGERLSAT